MLPVKGLLGKKDKSAATLGRVGECSPSGGLACVGIRRPPGCHCVSLCCCPLNTNWLMHSNLDFKHQTPRPIRDYKTVFKGKTLITLNSVSIVMQIINHVFFLKCYFVSGPLRPDTLVYFIYKDLLFYYLF